MSTDVSSVSASKPGVSKAPVRSAEQIEADMALTRDRLAGTVAQLEARLNPKSIMGRQAKKVKDFYYDEYGLRVERVAMTAGAVLAGMVGLRIVSKSVRWMFAVPTPTMAPVDVVYVPVSRKQIAALDQVQITAS